MADQLVQQEAVKNPSTVKHGHVLLITFPAQGHINPALQFAKRLIQMGVQVTFATSLFAHRRILKSMKGTQLIKGLTFGSFSDGYDDGYRKSSSSDTTKLDTKTYISEMKNRGSKALKEIIQKRREPTLGGENQQPISRVVYTLLLPWAAEVARECHVPSALLWIQPATVLDIYYFYFNGYEDEISKNCNDPNWSIQFPGNFPLLSTKDPPSFFTSSVYNAILDLFKEQLDTLEAETEPKILVNTFDKLEPEALKAIEKFNLIAVGPLIPSAFLDGKDETDSFGGDLFEKSKDYLEWLNSKPPYSVVYISFGSIIDLPKNQLEEIAKALLETGSPFLWVIRKKDEEKKTEEQDEALTCFVEELEKQGIIVPWCSQLEVLTHPSLGCFVTHCGWNSTLESIVCGVPVVAFPQWTDQKTNAKLLEDVWKTGVRVRARDDGVVESVEIRRCIEIVMDGGERGDEFRENAQKWKGLAREALGDGGTSYKNLKSFVEEVGISGSDFN